MAKRPAKKTAKRAKVRSGTRASTPARPKGTNAKAAAAKPNANAKAKPTTAAKATPKPKANAKAKPSTTAKAAAKSTANAKAKAKPTTTAKATTKPSANAKAGIAKAKPATTKAQAAAARTPKPNAKPPAINLIGVSRDAIIEPVPGAHSLGAAMSDVVAIEVEAEAAIEAGNLARAIAIYTRLIDRDNADTPLASHLVARGRAYYRAGDHERAIGDFERGLAIEPHFPDIYFDKGKAELYAGRFGDADASFTRDLELDPSPISFYNRHLARKSLGDRDGALTDLDCALEGLPDEIPVRVARSILLASSGDLDGALADAEHALALDPRNISLHDRCGRLALGLGRCERAAEAYAAARNIALDAGDIPDVEHLAGEALAIGQLGRHADALTLLDRAVAIEPDNASLHCNRGWMFHLAGRDTDALADLDRAIALDNTYAKALQNRAAIYTARGDRSRALADYRRLDELGHDVRDAIARLVAP